MRKFAVALCVGSVLLGSAFGFFGGFGDIFKGDFHFNIMKAVHSKIKE